MTVQDGRHVGATAPADAGLSLIEAIVAVVLLSLVAVTVLPAIMTGSRTAATNRDMAKAAQYVATELEIARTMTCASVRAKLPPSGTGFLSPPDATGSDGAPEAYSGYTLRSVFTDTPGGTCVPGQTFKVTTTAWLDGRLLGWPVWPQPVTASTLVLAT